LPHLIEVSFKGNRREFFVWEGEEPPRLHAPVIVEADRGEDLGRVNSVGELAERRCTGCAHGCGTERPTRKAIRAATADDERRAAELRVQDDEARRKAMEKVRTHSLVMKVSDAEWQWDRRKLTFYFTAEKRVDFRSLVRDLAAVFRTRIELKQIGVRDEAKRLSGVGRCGREYCSASWLPDLRPVNLQIAKDQRLSLNPSQISGACGRLMCCLRYEHEFYVQARKRFPKEGRILVTVHGEEKVIANDIFRDRVTLRSSEGDIRVVPVAELGGEMRQSASFAVDVEEDAAGVLAGDSRDDDVPDETDPVQPARPLTAESASGREAPRAEGAPHTSGRRRGRRGGRRGRPGNDAQGSPLKE
jgi:cell fate regulator YaaT (PSP1 superfamily)